MLESYKQKSKKGFLILAVAWQAKPRDHDKALIDDEAGFIFVGFALFYDSPKVEARRTLASLKGTKSRNLHPDR